MSWRTGSEVVGLDLRVSDQLADATIAALWQLLGERGILLFRGQVMDHDQHIAFTRRFGPLAKAGLLGRHAPAGCPDIFTVTNIKKDGQRSETENAAQQWHSDQSLLPAPARASLLRTWHTLFSTRSQRLSGRKAFSSVSSEELERMKGHAHPVIRTHADTGKKTLYVSEQMVDHFDGWSTEDSAPLDYDFAGMDALENHRLMYRTTLA